MEVKIDNKKPLGNKKEKVLSPWKIVGLRLKKNKMAMLGLYLLIFMVAMSIFGPIISPYNMETIDFTNTNVKPSLAHPLGTDEIGRDILTRLMYGGRVSIMVGVVAVILELLIGIILGGISGYYGGVIDAIIMRIVDIFMCFPSLPFLIMLSAVMSDWKVPPQYRMFIVMFILGLLGWPGICRLVRGQILSLREQEFMQAVEALGIRDRKRIFGHLLPNTMAAIIVTATLGIGGAILAESALSYLGLGVTPPVPSWGQMIQAVNDMYTFQYKPWTWMPAGICILITVVAINLFGDGLRDALDPKLKR